MLDLVKKPASSGTVGQPIKGKIGVLIEDHFDMTEFRRFNEFFPAEGYQVVYAVRTKRKEHVLKRLAYAGFYRFLPKVPKQLAQGGRLQMMKVVARPDVTRRNAGDHPFVAATITFMLVAIITVTVMRHVL